VAEQAELIRNVSRAVARRMLCGLAEVAVYQGYLDPMVEGRGLLTGVIRGGEVLPSGFFVPNSTTLGREELFNRTDAASSLLEETSAQNFARERRSE